MTTSRTKRASNRPDSTLATPLFLRKTFEMISNCDPNIAGWSVDGNRLIVKDPDKFQTSIIPQYFKHNKLSSFVRQLHFYGFHKVKTEPLNILDADMNETSKYWVFSHDKFRRDRPDLMKQIRKSTKVESADKQEVQLLRQELNELKAQVSDMANSYEALKALMGTLLKSQQPLQEVLRPEPMTKKQRIQPPEDVPSAAFTPDAVGSLPVGIPPLPSFPSPLPVDVERNTSLGASSWTTQDDEFLTKIFSEPPSDNPEADSHT